MIPLGTLVRWRDDIGVVFKMTLFNEHLEEEVPEWCGCVVSVHWQTSPKPTVHIFYSDGAQGFGFPIVLVGNKVENS